MLILARLNGYHSSYSPQSITEEEQRCLYGNVFSNAEKEFFKYRLQAKFPKISKESIETALVFMEKQKIANCPCLIHTESRGYEWVVFRRQPDRIPTLYYDVELTESEEEDEQEDDYYSVEPVDNDETQDEKENQDNCEMNPDVTGAASSTNEDLPDGLDETSKESGPGDTSSLHSRDQYLPKTQKKTPDDEEEVMNSEDFDDNQSIMCAVVSKRSNYVCFKPLMYYNKQLDRNYYYR